MNSIGNLYTKYNMALTETFGWFSHKQRSFQRAFLFFSSEGARIIYRSVSMETVGTRWKIYLTECDISGKFYQPP